MSFEIVAMSTSDYDEVLYLWQASAGLGVPETRDQFCAFLERNPGLSVIARSATGLVGAVFCGHDGRRGYLYHLAVADAFRRRGVARALVEACLVRLEEVDIPRCSIHLYMDNESGHAFWRNIGWRDRNDLRIMAIDLASDDSPA